MYNAEDVFVLLNSHNQELALDNLAEIQKQSIFETAMMPKPDEEEDHSKSEVV
jgi:hypothetical protein